MHVHSSLGPNYSELRNIRHINATSGPYLTALEDASCLPEWFVFLQRNSECEEWLTISESTREGHKALLENQYRRKGIEVTFSVVRMSSL